MFDKHLVSAPVLSGLALAAALAAAPGAQAATASASLGNVYVQVFDLDMNDGIAAAVTFDSSSPVSLSTNATQDKWVTSDDHYDNGALGAAFGPLTSTAGAATATAQVLAGDLFTLGSGPGASSSASASGLGTNAYGYGAALQSNFTLTPHTVLVISADHPSATASAVLGETASAYASIQISPADYSGYSYAYAADDFQANGQHWSNSPASLQASFVNLTGSSVQGWAYVSADANAAGVTAVPEPRSNALLLAGLMAVGFVVRRRTRD